MINLILYLLLLLALLLFLIFMSFYSLSLIYSSIKGSPYVATKNKAIIDMFAKIKFIKGKKFLELGSGDGRISRYVAYKYGLYTTGVDVNILLVWWARFLTFLSFKKDPSTSCLAGRRALRMTRLILEQKIFSKLILENLIIYIFF